MILSNERIAECRKICACIPFIDGDAGVPETMAAMRDLITAYETLVQMAFHTAPNQLDFAPEGWTWKQQAQRNYERIVELEAERDRAQRELETVAMRLDSLHDAAESNWRRVQELEGRIGNASL